MRALASGSRYALEARGQIADDRIELTGLEHELVVATDEAELARGQREGDRPRGARPSARRSCLSPGAKRGKPHFTPVGT